MTTPTEPLAFQDLILTLHRYWGEQGCAILQPYDIEVGAGTLHPATVLRALGQKPWKAAYVQPSRRPGDGRYGENPNRLQHYYQYQVILKPNPDNLQELYLGSLKAIGIDPKLHDIRFVEDDWENPTVGAWGLGWEVWCDGMEVTQFTYFQGVGGIEVDVVSGELTYGLERLAMYVQGVDNVYDLKFNKEGLTYGDVFLENERQQSAANFHGYDVDGLKRRFEDMVAEVSRLLNMRGPQDQPLVLPAYDPGAEGQPPVQPDGCARRHRRRRTPELHRSHPRTLQSLRPRLCRTGTGRGMSDETVISLADRRPKLIKPVGGGAVVTNDALYIPMTKVASHEVQWAFQTSFDLDGEKDCPLQGSFLAEPLEDDEPLGSAYEHEHGVSAQFVVGQQLANLIGGAALSPVPFEITVGFYADETGAVRDLSLSIQRRQAD